MRDKMNISVNGQSRVPPGFRFHPTEEELLQYYLRKKVNNDKIDLDVIFEVDLNKLEPWDIQEKCKIGSTPQNDWYFFSHKDKKYPTGTRTNRATAAGFWKATGRDKVIYSNSRRIGMRKTLVFYKGRAPHGQKSDWIMHEYRLYDSCSSNVANNDSHVTSGMNGGDIGQEEGWVVCRIFKKKNHSKALDGPMTTSTITMEAHSSMLDSSSDHDHDHDHHDQGALEQIFQFMGTKPQVTKTNTINTTRSSFHHRTTSFMKLPSLDERSSSRADAPTTNYHQQPLLHENDVVVSMSRVSATADPTNSVFNTESATGFGTDWAALDRFVATHLNGQPTEMMALASIFSSSTTSPYPHPDEHDHDHIELPPLRSSPSTSSGIMEMYQPAATLDDYGGNEIDL